MFCRRRSWRGAAFHGRRAFALECGFLCALSFLPRCSLWLKVWFADDELPPSGRLLIDESAPHYLTIEDAVTAGSLILDALTGAQHWNT